jgi:hypothetical protein
MNINLHAKTVLFAAVMLHSDRCMHYFVVKQGNSCQRRIIVQNWNRLYSHTNHSMDGETERRRDGKTERRRTADATICV